MISIFGEHDKATVAQAVDVSSRAERFALMADGHKGYVMPVGGVAAYRDKISPIGVGPDIACGNAAIRTDLYFDDIRDDLEELADEIANTISFGVGHSNSVKDAPHDDDVFEWDHWEAIPRKVRGNLQARARSQLGTVGGGNHYVDVFRDENDVVWVGVHFGSRGFGFITASGFVSLAQGGEWNDLRPRANMNQEVLLDLNTPLGADYFVAMELAGGYAYAGREWVARKVVDILGGRELELIHNHHNYAWPEEHDGEHFIVVRKGATPAWDGQKGFVGGSMGDKSVILHGRGDNPETLRSTVHGAGRIMGRMAAKGKWKRGECVRPGLITHEQMAEATEGVVVRGGDLDEAPQAYRKLEDVLAAQGDTIEVLHELTPVIVCMAPGDTVDPYKD